MLCIYLPSIGNTVLFNAVFILDHRMCGACLFVDSKLSVHYPFMCVRVCPWLLHRPPTPTLGLCALRKGRSRWGHK